MSLRLGYKASAEQFGPNELLDYSILAEQRGFDSVFISDHFQPWRHTGGHAPFSMAWMGAMFPKRVILSVGTGESLNEVPALGLTWPEPKERTARLKEALALIRQLWSEERVSFKGQFYRCSGVHYASPWSVTPTKSLQPPPYSWGKAARLAR